MAIDYSVRIVAGLDATQLKAGLKGVKSDLSDVSTEAKRTGLDLNTLGKNLKAGLGQIEQFGTAALGIITALGLTSPALAGVMARISTEMFKLSDTIGSAVKPYVEWFAGALEEINNFLQQNPWVADLTGKILALGGAIGMLNIALKVLSFILNPILSTFNILKDVLVTISENLTPILETIGGIAGTGGALTTATIGAGGILGGIAGETIGKSLGTFPSTGNLFGALGRIAHKTIGGAIGGGLTALALGQLGPQVAAPEEVITVPAGAVLGGAIGGIGGIAGEIWDWWNKKGPYSEITINNTIQMDGKTIAEEVSKKQIDNLSYMSGAGGE